MAIDKQLLEKLLALIPSVTICIEFFIKLPCIEHFNKIKKYATQALSVINSSKISDHWKEKILPTYSIKIFISSFLSAFYLFLVLSIFISVYSLIGILFSDRRISYFIETLYHWETQISIIVFAMIYIFVRKKWVPRKNNIEEEDYTFSSKMLHQLALGSSLIQDIAFDIDCAVSGVEKTSDRTFSPVYVAGIARAGTTILLESLYKTGSFATLTYRDMPFITAPLLWSRISGRSRRFSELKQRAHGDGLYVNYDSPEAFEEIFWKTFTKEKYIKNSYLEPWKLNDEELVKKYRKYVFNIVKRTKTAKNLRYLSKNNNNLLRIESIKTAFPEAQIIVPFRHPADHASSLKAQHEKFLEIHRKDQFTLKYMNWLGHFEFGANVKLFKFSEEVLPKSPEELMDIRYWIKYWKSVYEYIYQTHASKVIFFDYNRFCKNPVIVFKNLENLLSLEDDSTLTLIDTIKPAKKYTSNSFPALPPDVKKVYQKLQDLSI